MTVASEAPKTDYWMIGCPTYDGRISIETSQSIRGAVSRPVPLRTTFSRSSLLPGAFNHLVCHAVNDDACKYFAMIHSDVQPEQFWLEKMVDILECEKLDVLSALIPIRDETGLTSTALDMPPEASEWKAHMQRRLSMREAFELPETIRAGPLCQLFHVTDGYADASHRALLINTGLMLWRMSTLRPLARNGDFSGFELASHLVRDDEGKVRHVVEPEDWRFSRWAALRGLAVAATRAVKVNHIGADATCPNTEAWGTWETDRDWEASEATGKTLEEAATAATGGAIGKAE